MNPGGLCSEEAPVLHGPMGWKDTPVPLVSYPLPVTSATSKGWAAAPVWGLLRPR